MTCVRPTAVAVRLKFQRRPRVRHAHRKKAAQIRVPNTERTTSIFASISLGRGRASRGDRGGEGAELDQTRLDGEAGGLASNGDGECIVQSWWLLNASASPRTSTPVAQSRSGVISVCWFEEKKNRGAQGASIFFYRFGCEHEHQHDAFLASICQCSTMRRRVVASFTG